MIAVTVLCMILGGKRGILLFWGGFRLIDVELIWYRDIQQAQMDEEGGSNHTTKSPKMFLLNVEKAFAKRDGERLYKEFKELYLTPHYQNINAKSWSISIHPEAFADCGYKEGPLYAAIVENVLQFAMQRSREHWEECFMTHMTLLVSVLKALEEMKEYREWVAKGLRVLVRATKSIFLAAQQGVNNSASAAKLKNTMLNTLQRFKSARSLIDEVKRQYLPLVDIMQVSILLSFHNYEQIQRILYSPKIYGEIGPLYIDNYMFQKGKYALVNQNLKEAEECFSKINIRTQGQKKLVLRYLIPCKMLLGRMFKAKKEEEATDYAEYIAVIRSIVEADFKLYDELSLKYQKVWLKRGIYLLMDRVRILLWRNLVKKLSLIVGNKIEMEMIERAVKLRGGNESIDECVCIVGNLIYEGYAKGYIFQNQVKRTLVLKSSNAFPPLSQIAH